MSGAVRRKRKRRSGIGLRRMSLHLTPVRLVIALLLLLVGGWLIATRSLPFAIAETDPETAAWLSPDHPAPQLVLARQLRDELLRSIAEDKKDKKEKSDPPEAGESATKAAKAARQAELKLRIVEHAKRIIRSEPLNAEAYRMLGEVANDQAQAREFMEKAVARSRRESIAVYWLLNDSATRGDFDRAFDLADILLRSRPQLSTYVVGYLAHMAEKDKAGFDLLVERLAREPPWRRTVLHRLPRAVRDVRTPLRVMAALKKRGSPVTPKNYHPYLNFLIGKKNVRFAYAAWLQLQTPEELALVRRINNGGFDRELNGGPFGWRVGRSQNALTAFEPHPTRPEGRAFRAVFGDGQVRFAGPRQVLVLEPGAYVVTGEVTGKLEAKRGLKWTLRCHGGKVLGESDTIRKTYANWTVFSFTVEIPKKACRAQQLHLRHTSRSASETFASGEIWFDNIDIARQKESARAAE